MPAEAPREIELKFVVVGNQAGLLADVLALWPVHKKTHQVTTYFDTPDNTLALLGLSLRVRHTPDRFVQTLKADRTAGVAANRAEWEWPVDANRPDLGLLAGTPFKHLSPNLDLHPVVVTTIDRAVRIVEREDGTQIEVAFDEGMISAGNAHQPVRELELELRRGNLVSLLRWALELHAAVPLTIESESKAQRGYRLKNISAVADTASSESGMAQGTGECGLDPDMPPAEAFRRLISASLGHLLANQSASLAGEASGVRQMRLAIRRLRAALTLFRPHLEPSETVRFQSELRRIASFFKDAQDGDALRLDTLPDDPRPRPRATACRPACLDLDRELRGPPFTALVLGLAAWVEQGALSDFARLQPLGQIVSPLRDRLAGKGTAPMREAPR